MRSRAYDQCVCGRRKAKVAQACRSCYRTRSLLKERSVSRCPKCRKPKDVRARRCRTCYLGSTKEIRGKTRVRITLEQKQRLSALAGPHRAMSETVGLLIDAAYVAKKGRAA